MRRRQPIAVAGDQFGGTRMSKVSSCSARGKNRTSGWIDQSADLGAKVRWQMRDEARRSIPRSLLSVDSHPSNEDSPRRRGSVLLGGLRRSFVTQPDEVTRPVERSLAGARPSAARIW